MANEYLHTTISPLLSQDETSNTRRTAWRWSQSSAPQWMTSILMKAARMSNDKLRRKKAYKMLQKRLWITGIGQQYAKYPTYVYPENIKALIRSVFPKGICNYPDPDHEKVVRVTMEDLFMVQA